MISTCINIRHILEVVRPPTNEHCLVTSRFRLVSYKSIHACLKLSNLRIKYVPTSPTSPTCVIYTGTEDCRGKWCNVNHEISSVSQCVYIANMIIFMY